MSIRAPGQRRASAGPALARRCWPGAAGPALLARRCWPGAAGPALLARRCWPGAAGPALLARRCWPGAAGPALLARRCWPGAAGPALLARPGQRSAWLAYALLALLGFVPAVAQAAAPTVQNEIPDQAAGAGTAFSYAFPANTFNDADGDTLSYTAVEDGETGLPTWLTFTATSRTFSGTPAVADAETLTVKVTANDGNSGTVSDTFDILVGATDVCLRTPEVRDAIVLAVSSASTCVAVTTANLAAITGTLNLGSKRIGNLRAGDFDGLTALTRLDLDTNNRLLRLPAGIFDNLTVLTQLNLLSNSLLSLPAGIFDNLTELETLALDTNSLQSLPAGVFDNLTALTDLTLSRNSLQSLPAGVFDNLTALTDLTLSRNRLMSLPAGVFDNLTALQELWLHRNSLPSLRAGVFDKLTKLTDLTLSENNLTTLRAGVFDNLTSLTGLQLQDNSLSSLRAGVFDNLTSLTQLQLEDNSLSSLPEGVFDKLTNLTELRLNGNPGAPFKPVARAGAGRRVPRGAYVEHSGKATGAWGDNVTWAWTQVDGPSSNTAATSPVTITNATSATMSFTAPSTDTILHFRLVVTPRPGANTARGIAADTDWETFVVGATTPAAPRSLTVRPDAGVDTSMVLSWAPGSNYRTAPITKYQVSWSPGGSFRDVPDSGDAGSSTADERRYTVTGLTVGTTYTFYVRAHNSKGGSALAEATAKLGGTTATGAPSITAPNVYRVPAVLTADLSNIADADGKTGIAGTATYQWLRRDGTTDSTITSATGSTYTLTAADVGKKVKVRVNFTDDAGNAEGPLTSAATPLITSAAACEAPTLTGGAALIGSGRKVVIGNLFNANGVIGYSASPRLGFGSMADRTFSIGGKSHRIQGIYDAYTGFLLMGLNPKKLADRSGLILHVCDTPLQAYEREFGHNTLYGWRYGGVDPNVLWRGHAERTIYLSRDTTFPTVSSAALNGQSLVITFSEPLYTNYPKKPAHSAYTVKVGRWPVERTNIQQISGNTLTLALRNPVLAGRRVTVSYAKPATGSRLKDLSGNEVASFTDQAVTRTSLQMAAPSVTAVAISPAPGGDGWDAGEMVEAVLTFDEAVTVDTTNGTPHVQFELGTDTTRKDAGYASGSGTTALTFRHTVPAGEGPHTSALLVANSLALDGGAIRSTATGADADLAHGGAAYAGVITPNASARSASSGPTAQFSALPASHDGTSTFEAELTFSADPDGLSYVTVRDSLLEVTGGAVENARRKTRGSDIGWVLTVRPSGRGSVTLTLPSRACGQANAICSDDEPLASDATAAVPGPATVSTTPVSTTPALPTISIAAPAQTPVTEGAALSFTLTRTGATDEALTVAVSVTETGDVLSATPPASVTFAQGSTTATLNVGTVDDTTVEDASTVTVTVTDGTGYTVDGDAASASGLVESEDLAPITARFTYVTDEHDESAFVLRFAFSHAPLLNYVTVRDALFDVTGGRIEYVRRLTWGNNIAWELRVKPDGFGDVTLSARATTDCEAAHGVCDAAGRRFDGALERTIQGPPTLSVADAEVEEAEGATLEFTVTLSRSLDEAVTVTYATADGTATAGSDYRAANDTLTFTAGETAKTVSVAVLYNTHDEGSETLTLSLTSPSPSRVKLADADATGTITNTGPLPAAWTARFGRTVAEQVLDAVEGRMEAGRTAGLEVILAGEPITWQPEAAEGSLTPTGEDVFSDVVGRMGRRVHSGSLTSENVLSGSSFTLTRKNCKNCENGGGHSDKGLLALWGHGAVSSFDGQEDEDDLSLTGDVSSAMVGADWGGERVLAGLVVGHSSGNGSYRSTGGNGVISSSLTGLYPWARYELNEQLEVWGAAGYGAGSLTLTPDGEDAMDTDLSLWMGAAGLRGLLIDGGAEGFTLAATTDALAVTTTTAAVAGEMAATDAGVTRLRLGLEGSLPVKLSDASLLTTSIEMGLRHDDGDAETGFGLEMGAGLAWHHVRYGLRAELRGRGLLTHAAEGFSNRGLSLSLAWDPTPASALGASFSLSQSMGGAATGGVDALLSPITMAGLTNTNGDGGREMENQRLELRLGYGLPAFSHAFSLTPELVVGLSETERDYSLLLALAPLGQDGSMDVSLDLIGKQSTSSSSNGAGAIEHSLGLRFTSEF